MTRRVPSGDAATAIDVPCETVTVRLPGAFCEDDETPISMTRTKTADVLAGIFLLRLDQAPSSSNRTRLDSACAGPGAEISLGPEARTRRQRHCRSLSVDGQLRTTVIGEASARRATFIRNRCPSELTWFSGA